MALAQPFRGPPGMPAMPTGQVMDVSSASALAAANAQNAQSMAMLVKTLRAQRMMGQEALQLIANAPVGANEPGKGQLVDVRA